MKTKIFPYSSSTWFAAILSLGINIFPLYGLVTLGSDYRVLLCFGLILLCTAGMLGYFCKKFLFPFLRRDTALELDEDKLQFYITNRTIYWKDIKKIDHFSLNHGGWSIDFTMKDGSDQIRISTKYIAGDNEDIYNTIVEYFEH